MRQVHLEGLMTLNNSEYHILIIDIMQPVFLRTSPCPRIKRPRSPCLHLFYINLSLLRMLQNISRLLFCFSFIFIEVKRMMPFRIRFFYSKFKMVNITKSCAIPFLITNIFGYLFFFANLFFFFGVPDSEDWDCVFVWRSISSANFCDACS